MAGNQRTRQSNRAYQNHIRQENRNNSNNRNHANRNARNTKNAENSRDTRSVRNSRGARNSNNSRNTRNSNNGRRNSRAAGNIRSYKDRESSRQVNQPIRQSQQADARQQGDSSPRQQSVGQVYFDYTLVFIVFFLVMFGLLMLYTASIYTNSFFIKQCAISVFGMVVMFVFAKIDYHLYAKKPMIILIAVCSIISVLLVLTPLGVELNGARRWIQFGGENSSLPTIQPAEIFKIAVVLVNAFLITKLSRQMAKWQVLSIFALMALVEMFFILGVTDNLSSGIIVGAITVLMVFVAHPGYKLFVGGGICGALVVYGYIKLSLKYANSGSGGFRSDRIIAWLAPELLEDQSKVYQTTQALYSIGSGGLWGKGLGAGTQKMILPEAMNDMIFAIICEELGMIGAFLVLVMFAILLYRLMFIARNSKDLLGGMIATGIFAHFMLQVVLNIGVVTNLLPSTGVTLPFISAGGTASVLLMAEVGIALNVSRQIDFEQPKLVRRKKRH